MNIVYPEQSLNPTVIYLQFLLENILRHRSHF